MQRSKWSVQWGITGVLCDYGWRSQRANRNEGWSCEAQGRMQGLSRGPRRCFAESLGPQSCPWRTSAGTPTAGLSPPERAWRRQRLCGWPSAHVGFQLPQRCVVLLSGKAVGWRDGNLERFEKLCLGPVRNAEQNERVWIPLEILWSLSQTIWGFWKLKRSLFLPFSCPFLFPFLFGQGQNNHWNS